MPLNPALDNPLVLPLIYRNLLKSADTGRRDILLARRFDRACLIDPHMQTGATADQMYYKGFAQALRPTLVQQLIAALNAGSCPEIEVTLDAGRGAAVAAGYFAFGSPQDFLYGFTSERQRNWSRALLQMGFKSAVMVGEQRAAVTMAPRYLDFTNPTLTVDELAGAIASDFWETSALAGSTPVLTELLDDLYGRYGFADYAKESTDATIDADLSEILANMALVPLDSGQNFMRAELVRKSIERIQSDDDPALAYKRGLRKKRPIRPKERQEQIALKYVVEGNFLQKLLDGARVDHIQSNVKNQKNPIRGSGCEVDSIYRVIGEKAIVLVEAKAGNTISRSQLYQMYETFRLKLPRDWEVKVVSVLLTPRQPGMPETVRSVIDMAEIKIDDAVLGRVTESLLNMRVHRHYRWRIHQ